MEEYWRIRAALAGHSDQVFDLLAVPLARLGSRLEWSLDDNLDTTEELARSQGRSGCRSRATKTLRR